MFLKFIFPLLMCCFMFLAPPSVYKLKSGSVEFVSKAPMETIKARTTKIKGVFEPLNNKFSFSVDVNSFEGFNSDLQKQHFVENYMDGTTYPTATFKGKIIDVFDISKKEKITVRAKGKIDIHGISTEIILPCTLHINSNNQIVVDATFSIDLATFNIAIPRVVSEKLSKYVDVSVKCVLQSM